jgi:hypothetical protein
MTTAAINHKPPPQPATPAYAPTLVTAAERIARQLDQRGNPQLRGLPDLLLRALKLQEEAGELAGAVIGVLGQNPRKGITHTWDDVLAEAVDVALTALVLAETVRPGHLAGLLAQRLAYLEHRAAASGAPTIPTTHIP